MTITEALVALLESAFNEWLTNVLEAVDTLFDDLTLAGAAVIEAFPNPVTMFTAVIEFPLRCIAAFELCLQTLLTAFPTAVLEAIASNIPTPASWSQRVIRMDVAFKYFVAVLVQAPSDVTVSKSVTERVFRLIRRRTGLLKLVLHPTFESLLEHLASRLEKLKRSILEFFIIGAINVSITAICAMILIVWADRVFNQNELEKKLLSNEHKRQNVTEKIRRRL